MTISKNVSNLLVLLIAVLIITLSYSNSSLELSAVITASLIGIPIALLAIVYNKFGLLFVISLSSCAGLINRILPGTIPFGLLIDLLLYCLFIYAIANFTDSEKKQLKNPVFIYLILWTCYYLFQIMNPEGTIGGWIQGVRIMSRVTIIYLILFKALDSLDFIEKFTRFYVGIGICAGLYGIYQEYFGLPWYDLDWATASDRRINLLFIGGKWRKFSFMSDPSAYGLFMALMSIMTLFFALKAENVKKRIGSYILFVISTLGLFASGIRTAYVVIPVGIFVYVLFNITNLRTLVFAASSVIMFMIVYFGPFYNPTIVRFRSAFRPSDDPSMLVRDINRQIIQPYIYSHPFGGGLSTTGTAGLEYAPKHKLAGFPPDGGFMETLLELGIIGLIIEMAFYSTVIYIGIKKYFKTTSQRKKKIYGLYIIGFFALTIAYYAKKGVDQFPLNFFLYTTFVLVTKLEGMEDDTEKPNSG